MRIPLFLRAIGALLFVNVLSTFAVRAQSPTPAAGELYPDSPARANPRNAGPRRVPIGAEAVPRVSPRGPQDWQHVECLSPDGRLFVSINLDGRRRIWDLVSGRSEVELPAGVTATAFSPDSRSLACRTATGWQVLTVEGKPAGAALEIQPTMAKALEHVVFSPDAKRLTGFINAAEPSVICFNIEDGKLVALQAVRELQAGAALIYSPDGRILVAVGSGAAGVLLNAADLKPIRVLAATGATFGAAAFSPDGKYLAIGGEERRTVRGQTGNYPAAGLYETATGQQIAALKMSPKPGASVRQVLFADGGRSLVTATDQNVQTWSTSDGRLQANLPDAVYPVALSPDGRTLAGSQFPDLACWSTEAWRLGIRVPNARVGGGRTGGAIPLIFFPDGSGAVAMRAASAVAWELPSGRVIAERLATQPAEN